MSLIIGINSFHGDSSACILRDGVLIAAAEEERFTRIKHWAGFPSESIRYCLEEAKVSLSDITNIAINQNPNSHLVRKINYSLLNRPSLSFIRDRLENKKKKINIHQYLAKHFQGDEFRGKVNFIEHHQAHLASTFFASSFEKASILSIDGFGDFASTAWGFGESTCIDLKKQIFFPHSLGIFYQAITQFIGFPNYGDEYKVMGLAPYGKDLWSAEMEKLVQLKNYGEFKLDLNYFCHHNQKIHYEWDGCSPKVGTLYADSIKELLGKPRGVDEAIEKRHIDIANSAQAMYERSLFHILNHIHEAYGNECIAIAGGCAMNSVANGKIKLNTPFRQVYIQSAAGDAGGAIGAALQVWYESNDVKAKYRTPAHDHAYWGPSYSNLQIKQYIDESMSSLKQASCIVEFIDDENTLCDQTAREIAKGLVIGWFQGRMEWGPRALGNRSIICDPRKADIKDILNIKIKKRESFRPFAPSILREDVAEWFEQEDDVPFMMQVFKIRQEKRSYIPAVTHVDGTGRLQTVSSKTNYLFHKLINSFKKHTTIPMVLNTSFNENEPVVCNPREALDCFLRTKMDMLVMGNWIIKR